MLFYLNEDNNELEIRMEIYGMILKHLIDLHFGGSRGMLLDMYASRASYADIKCDFKNPPVNNIFRAEARGAAPPSLSPLIHEYLTYSRSEGPRRPECGRPWTYIDHRCESNMNPKAKLTVHFRFSREAIRIRRGASISRAGVRRIEYLSGSD